MVTLKVGVADPDEMKARTMRIARGEEKPAPGDPQIWFASMESFALNWSTSSFVRYF